jgi:hypothetical protein
MIQLGEVTPATRSFYRGIDGGSEHVNHASLGMNNMLAGPKVRRFDCVQQNRLPPGHSHHYLTDGTFSVIEGWMTGKGFAGCKTLAELIDYLLNKFKSADAYRDKIVDVTVLVVNFAFTKWFSGHLNMSKVTGIDDPLVWRHTWLPDEKRVLVQYKYLISDKASWERDEWGPWIKKCIPTNDPLSGEVVMATVLRSDPRGIDLMHSWPEIGEFPGVEDWKPEDEWQFWKVFQHLSKWNFGSDKAATENWSDMKAWHLQHNEAAAWTIGEPIPLKGGKAIKTTPTLDWKSMWELISLVEDSGVDIPDGTTEKAEGPAASSSKSTSFLHPTGKLDRDRLSTSNDPEELNRVKNPNYTASNQKAKLAANPVLAKAYLEGIGEEGRLFFIKLQKKEGEFAVGIGRRTFGNQDEESASRYEVEWFERKGKKIESWGKQPGFRLTTARYERRKPVPARDVVGLDSFIPLVVSTTSDATAKGKGKRNEKGPEASGSDEKGADSSVEDGVFPKPPSGLKEFTLTQACMKALREMKEGEDEEDGESDEDEDDEDDEDEDEDDEDEDDEDEDEDEDEDDEDEEVQDEEEVEVVAKKPRKQ